MGQQQLLLLVLGIVIVGLAVVVGIQAFGENQNKANADAMVDDGIRIASDAQAWALKPAAFGGPSTGEAIGDVTFQDLGYSPTAGVYSNLNGDYTLTGTTGVACVLISGDGNTSAANEIYIVVSGTTVADIETAVNPDVPLSC